MRVGQRSWSDVDMAKAHAEAKQKGTSLKRQQRDCVSLPQLLPQERNTHARGIAVIHGDVHIKLYTCSVRDVGKYHEGEGEFNKRRAARPFSPEKKMA